MLTRRPQWLTMLASLIQQHSVTHTLCLPGLLELLLESPGADDALDSFRVVITAKRKTGRQVSDPTAAMMDPKAESGFIDEYEQYIPRRYNQQSELIAEVTEDGSNEFEFVLSSK